MSWYTEAHVITTDLDIASTVIVGEVMTLASEIGGPPAGGLTFLVPSSLSQHHVQGVVKVLHRFKPNVVRYKPSDIVDFMKPGTVVVYVFATEAPVNL